MENETDLFEPITPTPKKNKTWLVVGGVLVALLLVGAAFVAGRLLKQSSAAAKRNMMTGKGNTVMIGKGGGATAKEFKVENPEELPDRAPDVSGMMTRQEDNSIFVGTTSGPMNITVRKTEGGQTDVSIGGQNPGEYESIIEVVVAAETKIYRENPLMAMAEPGQDLDKVERKVEPMTLDELEGQVLVAAWGERKGDRLIAEVVLCTVFPTLDE